MLIAVLLQVTVIDQSRPLGHPPQIEDAALSLAVRIQPLATPILPQAVGGLLVQALYEAFNKFGSNSSESRDSFTYVETRVPLYNIGFSINAVGNLTEAYRLTGKRIFSVFSLLGYEFSNRENLTDFREFNFDVSVDEWERPEVIIAKGSVRNLVRLNQPD